jgi:hypothetical protein
VSTKRTNPSEPEVEAGELIENKEEQNSRLGEDQP